MGVHTYFLSDGFPSALEFLRLEDDALGKDSALAVSRWKAHDD